MHSLSDKKESYLIALRKHRYCGTIPSKSHCEKGVIVTGAESGMRCRQGKKARNRKHAASSLARKATREAVEIQEKEEKTG